jgi:hypothetical protein
VQKDSEDRKIKDRKMFLIAFAPSDGLILLILMPAAENWRRIFRIIVLPLMVLP